MVQQAAMPFLRNHDPQVFLTRLFYTYLCPEGEKDAQSYIVRIVVRDTITDVLHKVLFTSYTETNQEDARS